MSALRIMTVSLRSISRFDVLVGMKLSRLCSIKVCLKWRKVSRKWRCYVLSRLPHLVAAKVNNVEIVTILLEAGFDVNAKGNARATPLHRAAQTADQGMVQVLLDWRADITMNDMNRKSASQWAAQNVHPDGSLLLLDREVDERSRSHSGWSRENEGEILLQLAEENQKENLVVQAKLGNIEQSNGLGQTALLCAVVDGDLKAVRVLLGLGAGQGAANLKGLNALHLAAERGQVDNESTTHSSGHGKRGDCQDTAGWWSTNRGRGES